MLTLSSQPCQIIIRNLKTVSKITPEITMHYLFFFVGTLGIARDYCKDKHNFDSDHHSAFGIVLAREISISPLPQTHAKSARGLAALMPRKSLIGGYWECAGHPQTLTPESERDEPDSFSEDSARRAWRGGGASGLLMCHRLRGRPRLHQKPVSRCSVSPLARQGHACQASPYRSTKTQAFAGS